jgi:hypothetical protein
MRSDLVIIEVPRRTTLGYEHRMSRAALLKDLGRLRTLIAQEAGSEEVQQVQQELVERISWMGPSYNLWTVMVKHNGLLCIALSYCRIPVTH